MADYPTSRLNKALAQRASTSSTRPAWQELLGRNATVPSKAIQAPEVIQGFTGSWAAQYVLGQGQKTENVPESPAPIQRQGNHLGQPGMAEINFRPYDWGTTRHGKYGPSLLGHPVSFEVVGPTAKSPFLYHQWRVDTTGAQDVLTLDSCTWRSTVATPEALFPGISTITDIYGISAIPEEGLYLVVSLTGHQGRLDDIGGGVPGTGGLGDGRIGDDLAAIPARRTLSTGNFGKNIRPKFEVFRVTAMDATSLYLDGGKRLADYFDVPAQPAFTPIVRAVMLIKPAAARVVAVPGSGDKGKETVFAVVPPEKSLNSDLMPPQAFWTTFQTYDPWLNYNPSSTQGDPDGYVQANALPVPKVLRRGQGRLQAIFGEAPIFLNGGLLRIVVTPGVTVDAANDLGRVIGIRSVFRRRDGNWATATLDGGNRVGDPELDRLIGFWEIVQVLPGAGSAGEDVLTVRMITQVDPLTGVPFYGSTDFLYMAQTGLAAGMEVRFDWTLHDPVSSLWTASYLDQDKLNSARLRHLIDPDWVQPTPKNIDLTDAEASPSLPDKAIFGTASSNSGASGSNENPGNLMDLGFRLVLFPAKASSLDPTRLIPDFDNPITSNEVVLDPSLSEKQFIEVDYSAGLIYLSHAPVAGAGCDLAPNATILTNASNPRGEMVFFASFVPFSQEPGQRGTAVRVTGGKSIVAAGSACDAGFTESSDVYGSRLHWPLATGQTITVGTTTEIKLDVQLTALDIPATGFVELVNGNNTPLGTSLWSDGKGNRVCTFGYNEVIYQDAGNGGNTTLRGVFGGGKSGDNITTTAFVHVTAVLRREVVTPNLGNGSVGTDFQFDTTYGFSKRPTAVRFKRATMQAEADGSVTVDTRDPLSEDNQALFSDLFSSWVIRGGEMGTALPAAGGTVSFSEVTVLIQGVRSVLPAQNYVLDVTAGDHYAYIDGTAPSCPVYASTDTLPLPNSDDVLLGRYTGDGANVTEYQDLRQPLVDLDKRLEVTVGAPYGYDQPGDAHFATLADAVAFVAETMKPVAAGSSAGTYRRIKVIGPTREDSAKLPIRPRTPGLVIEGAARRPDGPPDAALAISWGYTDANAPALFDLSECNGITFRDLVFHFVTDGIPASVVPRERCLFTCDYVGVTDVLVENVRLLGAAHGFLYCNDDIDPAAFFTNVILRNCIAEELTDFAVWVAQSFTPSRYLNVDSCRFSVRKATDVPGPELSGVLTDPAILYLAGDGAEYVTVQNSYLHGGYHGIYLGGKRHSIIHTQIHQTDKIPVVMGGNNSTIRQVYAAFCHTEAAGPSFPAVPARVGLYFKIAGTHYTVEDCEISINAPVSGDYALYAEDNGQDAYGFISGSLMGAATKVGPRSTAVGNWITDKLILGSYSRASFNEVQANNDPGDIEAGDYCVLEGNQAEGRFNGSGADNCKFSNNWFQGIATANFISQYNSFSGDVFDGSVIFTNGGSFTGCRLNGGIVNNGVTSSDENRFQGCYIKVSADTLIKTNRTSFEGCYFESPGGSWTLEVDGYRNKFLSNIFDSSGSGMTVYLHDTSLAARTELVFSGNVVQGTTEGGVYINGDFCSVVGNIVQGYETISGANLHSLYVTGDYNTITGNNLTLGLYVQDRGTGHEVVADNLVETNATFRAKDSIYQGNRIDLDLDFQAVATGCVFQGNTVGDNCVLSGNECEFVGNRLENTLNLSGNSVRFKDNYVGGNAQMGSSGSWQELVGNTFMGTFTVGATDSLNDAVITGNHFNGVTNISNGGTASLVDCNVTGNFFYTTFTCQYAVRSLFSGNRFGGTTTFQNSDLVVVQGNWVGTPTGADANLDLRNCDDYTCMGNYVTGSLLITAGATATDCGIVMGNRAKLIGDGVGGAVPNNYQITMGNKVDNGVSGTVYGVNPATTAVNSDNISDDV